MKCRNPYFRAWLDVSFLGKPENVEENSSAGWKKFQPTVKNFAMLRKITQCFG
jgi:hypothetical protein